MHIPDGFLSPQTCAVAWAAAVPVWYAAWTQIKRRFEVSIASHIGIAAAFVFLIQMINVPIPGGTTGHAIGAALVTIALGPAAAIIAVSMALLLQAIVFGDGGILSYGANVLTMATVQTAVAWIIWRSFVRQGSSWKKKSLVGFCAGYAAAIAGAFVTGILLGIQPHLFQDSAGAPAYFPLGWRVSLTAMLLSHLLVGVVEGGVTLGAVRVLHRISAFEPTAPLPKVARNRLAIALAISILIVPAGVLLPAMMKSGDPWGEWSLQETAEVGGLASVPAGMEKYAGKYNAPVPDYQFAESGNLTGESIQYIGAAVLGVVLVGLLSLPLHQLQKRRLTKMRSGSKS